MVAAAAALLAEEIPAAVPLAQLARRGPHLVAQPLVEEGSSSKRAAEEKASNPPSVELAGAG